MRKIAVYMLLATGSLIACGALSGKPCPAGKVPLWCPWTATGKPSTSSGSSHCPVKFAYRACVKPVPPQWTSQGASPQDWFHSSMESQKDLVLTYLKDTRPDWIWLPENISHGRCAQQEGNPWSMSLPPVYSPKSDDPELQPSGAGGSMQGTPCDPITGDPPPTDDGGLPPSPCEGTVSSGDGCINDSDCYSCACVGANCDGGPCGAGAICW